MMSDIRVRPNNPAELAAATRRVFIRDLVLEAEIGAHRHERGQRQRVRINVDLRIHEDGRAIGDDLRNVVCYDEIASGIRAIVAAGHVNLVETLAERVAAMCLADARVARVRVSIEKLDVYPDVAAVGVEIERWNPLASDRPAS